jgi:pSer/pThr/pTyr-binding forkhead associated (FHA) protein
MSGITLRVLDGADRGRVFSELTPPVTIGREEGNSIQLNDERVSRYHIKIQEDHEKLVLTDLESTNGTKVNGEDIQLRILRFGDMITIGRSVLLYGSRDQIASRLAELRRKDVVVRGTVESSHSKEVRGSSFDFELNLGEDDMHGPLHAVEPPELPERLTAGQAAQLSEVLEFIHIRLRNLLNSVSVEGKGERLSLDARQWQYLLDLQSRIADYLRDVTNPNRM